jgi:Ca2+/Na+ antiporter
MLARIIVSTSVAAALLLVALLQTSTPSSIGPLGILLIFILIYVSVLGVLTFLLFIVSKIVRKLSESFTVKRRLEGLTLKRSYYFSSVIALAPVLLIAMQSIGRVGVYEFLLVILFVVVACTYISKRTS